jgi:hypothetical protein
MAKRQTLNYDSEELTQHLKQSAGQGVDAFFSSPSPTQSKPSVRRPPSVKKPGSTSTPRRRPVQKAPHPATALSTTQPSNSSVNRSSNRPVDPSVDQQLTGKVVDRPVAFYLPEVINQQIDAAVDYIEKRHHTKVDRSAIVSAILGNPALWEPEALNQLVDKAIQQLTSRLTSRLTR